jgi:hypothetical protein
MPLVDEVLRRQVIAFFVLTVCTVMHALIHITLMLRLPDELIGNGASLPDLEDLLHGNHGCASRQLTLVGLGNLDGVFLHGVTRECTGALPGIHSFGIADRDLFSGVLNIPDQIPLNEFR